MPRVHYIEDKEAAPFLPLRVTVRPERPNRRGPGTRAPSIRVKCGCCSCAVEIYHHDAGDTTSVDARSLEINGVSATLKQWRDLLGPLLETGVPKLPTPPARRFRR